MSKQRGFWFRKSAASDAAALNTALDAGPFFWTVGSLYQLLRIPFDPQIEIDGHDICQLAANELRSQLGVVPQETLLFAGSVYENLQLANPHASFDEIAAVCRMAEIHDTIEKFAATVNKLKGRVTMVFIAHQLPNTLLIDSVVRIDAVGAQI